MQSQSLHHHSLTSIDGSPLPLSQYKGKVVLLVNVASRCGFTSQYKGLQELYSKYQSRGLVVIGIPCNDFGAQEPGSESEIKTFCDTTYHVTFPLTQKLTITGADKHPLYADLTAGTTPLSGEVGWNFTKFLLDPDGRPVARFGSSTRPDDPKLIALIEAQLSER